MSTNRIAVRAFRRRGAGAVFIVVSVFVIASFAIVAYAGIGQDSDSRPLPGLKATEITQNPTPTPLAESPTCVVSVVGCGIAKEVATALRAGRPADVMARAAPIAVSCPDPRASGPLAARCQQESNPAAVLGHTFASWAKPSDFLDGVAFKARLESALGGLGGSPQVISVGCRSESPDAPPATCNELFAVVIGARDGAVSGEVLILVFDTSSSEPKLTSAALWRSDEAPVRGGSLGFNVLFGYTVPYMWFTPLSEAATR